MSEHRHPPQWVLNRAKCTLDLSFDALREIVERDARDANGISSEKRCSSIFDFERNGEGRYDRFSVWRRKEHAPAGLHDVSVVFTKLPTSITVEWKSQYEIRLPGKITIVPKWNQA